MAIEDDLCAAIARTLDTEVKAYSLVEACKSLGLEEGTDEEAWKGKARYVAKRLRGKPLAELLSIGDAALRAYNGFTVHAFELRESIRLARSGGKRRISEITRMNMVDQLGTIGTLQGRLDIDTFLRKLWPIDQMASHDPRHDTLGGEIWRHMVMNDDWTPQYVLDRLEVQRLSDEAFTELLELVVHPSVRQGDEQAFWVEAINQHLVRDRFALARTGDISGYPVYQVRALDLGIDERPKNLIFASTGAKPEIVLTDALHNDLKVVRHGEFCLFYDRQVPEEGLLWRELVAWWAESHNLDPEHADTARGLYRRLMESLKDSAPERALFKAYYLLPPGAARHHARLPALLPQVYVHFDPQTARQLYGEKRLPRQRMDFLLLLARGCRVVIEVDGVQHYSVDDRPNTRLYAEMVEADRQLRLSGYEVYRFGGVELPEGDSIGRAKAFFEELFRKHQVL